MMGWQAWSSPINRHHRVTRGHVVLILRETVYAARQVREHGSALPSPAPTGWLAVGHLGTLGQSSTRRDEWSAMGAKEQEVVPLHAGFDVVYRGFHRRQVIEHIDNLEDQLRYTSLDRAEAMAQSADLRKLLEMTRQDLEEARSRVERLEMSPSTTAGATERLHRMLLLAEDESAELRIRADREVTSLRRNAEVEVAE